MHCLISMTTAFVLLLHALVGCGGHLHHACPWCDDLATAAVGAVDCCDHDHGKPDLPSAPCRCQFACHQGCLSLPPQKLLLDDALATLIVAFVADGRAVGHQCFAIGFPAAASNRFSAEPPLALHLLHQILLI